MKQKGKVEFEGISQNSNRELMDMVHERDRAIREMSKMLLIVVGDYYDESKTTNSGKQKRYCTEMCRKIHWLVEKNQ